MNQIASTFGSWNGWDTEADLAVGVRGTGLVWANAQMLCVSGRGRRNDARRKAGLEFGP